MSTRQTRIFAVILCLLLGAIWVPGDVLGLEYPTREIEMISCYGPGSTTDQFAHLSAKFAEKYVGKPIVIINKTGGSGVIGLNYIAAAKPDGYTLGLLGNTIMTQPYLVKGVQFQYKSYRVIAQMGYGATGLFAKKGGPYDISLKELVRKAKEKPKSISMAISGGIWTNNDFSRALFEDEAGVQFNAVQYSAGKEIVPAVLGGHIDLGMGTSSQWEPLYKSGDFTVFAITTEERDSRYPKIPTFKELGWNVVHTAYYWIGAPAGTPDSIINFLADALQKANKEQGFREAVVNMGSTPAFQGPEACSKNIEQMNENYLKVIRKYDLKPQ